MSNHARTNVSQQIAVRVPLEDLARLDAVRGLEDRASFVRRAVRHLLALTDRSASNDVSREAKGSEADV